MTFKQKFIYFVHKVWYSFVIWWSNLYWKYIKRSNYDYITTLEDKHQISPDEDDTKFVVNMSNLLIDKFDYKHDGVKQLGDSIPPPQVIYSDFINKDIFSDDCDGFHSALSHILSCNWFKCLFLTIYSVDINKFGHCVCLYWDHQDNLHIQDYTENYVLPKQENKSIHDCICDLIEKYYYYKTGSAAIYFVNGYDYGSKKFYNISNGCTINYKRY